MHKITAIPAPMTKIMHKMCREVATSYIVGIDPKGMIYAGHPMLEWLDAIVEELGIQTGSEGQSTFRDRRRALALALIAMEEYYPDARSLGAHMPIAETAVHQMVSSEMREIRRERYYQRRQRGQLG